MTIKRTQRFELPIVGCIERTVTLKPGHIQKLKFEVLDDDTRGRYEGEKRIRIISPDAIEVTENNSSHYVGRHCDERMNLPREPYLLEKEDVRYLVDKAWWGKAWVL